MISFMINLPIMTLRIFLLFGLSCLIFILFSCSNDHSDVDRKAFGSIDFGVRKNEYYKKIDTILPKFKELDEYKIGKFRFTQIEPEFHADSLIKLTIHGVHYVGYSTFSEDYNAIFKSLSEKYGEPSVVFNDPAKLTSGKLGNFLATTWSSGFKEIEFRFCKYPEEEYKILMIIQDTFAKYAIESERIDYNAKESNKIKDIL